MHIYLGSGRDRICWPSPSDLQLLLLLRQGSGEDFKFGPFPTAAANPLLGWGGGRGKGGLLPSFALPPLFLLSTQWRSINKSCSCVQTLPVVSRGPSYSRLYASTHLASNNVLTLQLISSHPLLWRLCVFPLPSPPHAWQAHLAQVHPASHGIQTTWLPCDLSSPAS